jgi:hypothetical protein
VKPVTIFLIFNKGVAMALDPDKQFQEDLKTTLSKVDQTRLDRKEVLIDIFKTTVAKLFELQLSKSGTEDRLRFEQLVLIKNNIIRLFRGAELSEVQMSEKQYEDLFDTTVQEIMNDAASNHQGVDSVRYANQNLYVNADAYRDSHGMNAGSRFARTPAGIIIPK